MMLEDNYIGAFKKAIEMIRRRDKKGARIVFETALAMSVESFRAQPMGDEGEARGMYSEAIEFCDALGVLFSSLVEASFEIGELREEQNASLTEALQQAVDHTKDALRVEADAQKSAAPH